MMRGVSLLCLGVMGCTGPVAPHSVSPSVDYQLHRAQIVGGSMDEGDPAVVAVSLGARQPFCTGTLVGPRTVLTAAHCIFAFGRSGTYSVLFGTRTLQPTRRVDVVEQLTAPSYDGFAHDLGLLRLAAPITDVSPLALNASPLSAGDIGRTVRHVGFGIDDAQAGTGEGTKRQVSFPLRQVLPWAIESGAEGQQTCSGDSGGPALMAGTDGSAESIVGTVSYGDQACAQAGYDARVDVDIDWLGEVLGRWDQATCAADGLCRPGCAPVDLDCACAADGVCGPSCVEPTRDPDCVRECGADGLCSAHSCPAPDPDCAGEGGACQSHADCASRLCVRDEQLGIRYCSRGCTGPAGCAAGMNCNPAGLCVLSAEARRSLAPSSPPPPPQHLVATSGCAQAAGAPWFALVAVAFALRARRR